MSSIDLNVDVGEGFPYDDELIPLASSANIACAGHAGDMDTMRAAIKIAQIAGTHIGAHPGYQDRENFGRVIIDLDPGVIARQVAEQIDRLSSAVQSMNAKLRHVKLHGALYHEANENAALAESIMAAIATRLPRCLILVPPEGCQKTAAISHGLVPILEAYADRRYGTDGKLLPRNVPDAIIKDPKTAAEQAVLIAQSCQSICIHGDEPTAVATLCAVRTALEAAGYHIG